MGIRPASVSMILVMRSAPMTMVEPTIADPSKRGRCFGPSSTRAMCGQTKPTNPMGPARMMETVVRIPAPKSWVSRMRPIRSPILLASSSGRAPAS